MSPDKQTWFHLRGPLVWGLLVCALAGLTISSVTAAPLQTQRAERRSAQRQVQSLRDKAARPATFNLLVIPVDFQDARLPASYDPPQTLMPRLQPDVSGTLRNYFRLASGDRLALDITLAPLVHLDGSRRDYSDIGYQGFSRSRLLAEQSLRAVRDLGLDFRRLDNDGPDGLPGTGDDDGEVDGVLLLHAGVGQENDPEAGLIQALQFFLEDPVTSNGVQAGFYAVASLGSGLGIWAHETGHLLGLEDRYDPLLHPVTGGADVRSLGGLGRFSLMASGAWGRGDGSDPALLDAYSALSLGWATEVNLPAASGARDLRPVLQTGEVTRLWTEGLRTDEFYLLETRDPSLTGPYDGQIPGRQLLVYHVDESVPEGGWKTDGDGYHLRVRLVEADNDFALAEGLNDGDLSDLFPGSLGQTRFAGDTIPASWGYSGATHVELDDITVTQDGVSLTTSAATGPAVIFTATYSTALDAVLDLVVTETGTPLASLQGEVTAIAGHVDGSWDGSTTASFTLARHSDGRWVPTDRPVWSHATQPPAGAVTTFAYRFTGPGLSTGLLRRDWAWSSAIGTFAIPGSGWTVESPGVDVFTTWHEWTTAPWLTRDATPVLACTGSVFDSSADWPDVRYNNRAWVRRVSPPLGPEITGVRLVHAVETEILHTGTAMDGVRAAWRSETGERVNLPPVDGWDQHVSSRTANALAGAGVLADSLLTFTEGGVVWRTDVFPLPSGPGPWQLELTLASNSVWRFRGWIVAEMTGLTGPLPDSAFPVDWRSDTGLSWSWPFDDPGDDPFTVQRFDPEAGLWVDLLQTSDFQVPTGALTAGLPGGPSRRHEVRVVGTQTKGPLSTRPVVVYADGGKSSGPVLGAPRPNPSTGSVRLMLDVPDGTRATIRIHDVRGRRVRSATYPGGSHLFVWDGLDDQGAEVAAGTYFIRLEGSGQVSTRKVVLLK